MDEKTSLWPIDTFSSCPFFSSFHISPKDIVYPWEYLQLVINGLKLNINNRIISPNTKIASSAIIEGPVVIEEGVTISDNAKIIGPTYLGKHVTVGNCTLVRNSVIEEGSVIGYLVDVTRSYIGKSCWLSRSHVADSILSDHVNMGGGSVLTCLRLDNKPVSVNYRDQKVDTNLLKLGAIIGTNTQIGANVSVQPGMLIGSDCFIGPGVLVEDNLPNRTFCRLKQQLIVKENLAKYTPDAHLELKQLLIKKSS